MDRLRQRLKLAGRALATLQELAGLERPSAIERDAALQRFKNTFEAVWKTSQRYLLSREGVDLGSPKACIRAARDVELFSDAETEQALARIFHEAGESLDFGSGEVSLAWRVRFFRRLAVIGFSRRRFL
ncbi:MAG: nucleotidyltransferase substrate binding protein, partial [Proteobacteria bacterium]|nr:nucleotidyltransferase substrate binding protein [Pseudomonadota bacterium]